MMELTEHQRSLLQICLEIAEEKFGNTAMELNGMMEIDLPGCTRLKEQFQRQEKETRELSSLLVNADSIRLT